MNPNIQALSHFFALSWKHKPWNAFLLWELAVFEDSRQAQLIYWIGERRMNKSFLQGHWSNKHDGFYSHWFISSFVLRPVASNSNQPEPRSRFRLDWKHMMLWQSHGIWDLTAIFQHHKSLLSNSTVIIHARDAVMFLGLFKPSRCQVLGLDWSERIGSYCEAPRFKMLLQLRYLHHNLSTSSGTVIVPTCNRTMFGPKPGWHPFQRV